MRGLRQVVLLWLMVLLCIGLSAAENPTLSSLALGSASVVGGNSFEATVTLDMVAPFDLEVSLAADPSEAAQVPHNIIVAAGSRSSTFSISTHLSKNAVSGSDSTVTIYANYGVTRKASVSLLAPVSFDRMVDQVVEREREFVATMKSMHPLVETYVQNLHEEKDHMVVPTSDQYFLGRLDLSNGPSDQLFEKDRPGFGRHFSNLWSGILYRGFVPAGFAQMVMLDADFQKGNTISTMCGKNFSAKCAALWLTCSPKKQLPKAYSLAGSGLKTAISISSGSMEPTPPVPATATICTSIAGA